MTTIEIPAYIDPAVLVPGQTVRCVVDDVETVLTVVRVEPALICSRPDGTGTFVLAHTVVPVGTCDYCGHGYHDADCFTEACSCNVSA